MNRLQIMDKPRIHPQIFRHRMGSRYGGLIDRSFVLGYDPFEDHPLIGKKPAVNIKEDKEYYELEMPLPGYKREHISIHVEDNILTIKGEKEKDEDNKTEYIIKEHDMDSFERSFELGEITDKENITARFKDGVLYVRLNHIKEKEQKAPVKDIKVY